MLLIQFGRQVIHEINTMTAACLADEVALGNPQGADHQFLLTSGQNVGGIVCAQSQTQISTLRPRLGVPDLLDREEERRRVLR